MASAIRPTPCREFTASYEGGVANPACDDARARHQVDWRWVKGHAGDAANELCDSLAVAESKKFGR